MATDEAARHELFSRLEATLGLEAAGTLMAYLPPVGWADVATKRDLDQLEMRLDQRFALVDQRFEQLQLRLDQRFELSEQRILATVRAEMAVQTRTMLFAMIGVMVTFASTVLAAIKL